MGQAEPRPRDAAETLEQRIEAALNEAFDRQVAGGFFAADGTRGMVDDYDPVACEDVEPSIRLSLVDVARIAAAAAKGWF
jgi:hypothetical protein